MPLDEGRFLNDRRFRATVPFYVRYRPAYPAEFIAAVAKECRLDGAGRLLDLGCGPGYLAIPLAQHFAETVAMDPEPKMLEAALRIAGHKNVRLVIVRGSSDELGPHLGSFRMVTIGRAFHWMDRDATLASLDRLIEPAGCVVVVEDNHLPVAENAWVGIWGAVRRRWGDRREHKQIWEKAISALERSPFGRVKTFGVRYVRPLSVEQVIGRSYSMSVSSPAIIGANRAAFEEELRRRLLALHPTGRFKEIVVARAVVALRPLSGAMGAPG